MIDRWHVPIFVETGQRPLLVAFIRTTKVQTLMHKGIRRLAKGDDTILTMKTITWMAAFIASSAAFSAQATENLWKGEITPYLWAAGIDGEATVGNRTVDIDVGFDDLIDAVDVGGALLGIFQYRQLVFWGQIDYLSLSSDELDDSPERGTLESDVTITTLAAGYQFQGANGDTYDFLIGSRQLSLDNELRLDAIGTSTSERDVTDTVLMFRPDFPLSQNWRFDIPLSYGTGDSESTWEFWPQFQYQFSSHWATRLGYRRLYYDIERDGRKEFDVAFHGMIIGLGGTW